MALKLFEEIKGLSEDKIHEKFKLIKNNVMLYAEREVLNDWTKDFIDRDNKIVKEFQTTFHSSLWEFYLYALLREQGFRIDFSQERPDFMVKEPYEFNIEAVVSNIKMYGRPESERTLADTMAAISPIHSQENFDDLIDEAITRHSNSILSKYTLYHDKYKKLEWIKKEVPFVIALGSYDQIDYGREFYYPMMALLYGQYYNEINKEFEHLKYVIKPGTDKKVPIGIFNDSKFEDISAIIFSCTITCGKLTSLAISRGDSFSQYNQVINIRHDMNWPHYKTQIVSKDDPEELSDGLFIFHNPNAKNKLPRDVFSKSNAVQIFYDQGLRIESNSLPLVARINMSKLFINSIIDDVLNEINFNYNRDPDLERFINLFNSIKME
ncbi:hypothetical protein [Tepidibacter sp. Z1-5]|uniref:hypothetical protein n=1 Tax=Tepidibacter sp. Z1-5 TaxID=3134138 RepID=UPI0030C552B6